MRTPAQSQDEKFSQVATRISRKPLKYGITPEELKRFEEDGYLVKKGLLADLGHEMQVQADRLLAMEEIQVPGNLRLDWTNGEGSNIWKIDPFVDLDPFWSRLIRDRRLCDPLACIYEGREPRLMKDKLIYKPPQSRGNALHQDYTYWQGLPKSAISVCIAVDYTTLQNGATTLYANCHKQGLYTPEGKLITMDAKHVEGVKPDVICAEPGDVIFFGAFTPHEAGPNTTDGYRRQIFLTYNDSADGEWHDAHYAHYFSYRLIEASPEVRDTKFFL